VQHIDYTFRSRFSKAPTKSVFIIIIIIDGIDLGSVMLKDYKDTLRMLKTVTKRECDAK